jgi:hypothetical protein
MLVELDDRLTAEQLRFGHELLDQNELGVALEMMADLLSEEGTAITDGERTRMLGLASEMEMGDRVERTLALCPTDNR